MSGTDRAPWWRRRLGAWGVVCTTCVLLSIVLAFAVGRSGVWLAVQAVLLGTAALTYLVGLVRSPD